MSDCLCLDCKKDTNSLSDSVKTQTKNRREKLTELIKKESWNLVSESDATCKFEPE